MREARVGEDERYESCLYHFCCVNHSILEVLNHIYTGRGDIYTWRYHSNFLKSRNMPHIKQTHYLFSNYIIIFEFVFYLSLCVHQLQHDPPSLSSLLTDVLQPPCMTWTEVGVPLRGRGPQEVEVAVTGEEEVEANGSALRQEATNSRAATTKTIIDL